MYDSQIKATATATKMTGRVVDDACWMEVEEKGAQYKNLVETHVENNAVRMLE